LVCLGNPDPVGMEVYCPTGKGTFDDETTEGAPPRQDRGEAQLDRASVFGTVACSFKSCRAYLKSTGKPVLFEFEVMDEFHRPTQESSKILESVSGRCRPTGSKVDWNYPIWRRGQLRIWRHSCGAGNGAWNSELAADLLLLLKHSHSL